MAMKWVRSGAAAVLAISTLGVALPADATLITNGSFETGDFTGWTNSGNLVVTSVVSSNGTFHAGFNGGDGPTDGVLSQVLSVTNGATYSLSFDFGKYLFGAGTASLDVSVVGAGTLLSQTVSDPTGAIPSSLYQSFQFDFVADSNSVTLSFADTSNATIQFDAFLDNVFLDDVVVVPEPTTASLLALGLVGIAAVRRRRKA